jgi:hypothetical protein
METVHFRVPLDDSKDPRALGKALDELVRLSSKLGKKIDGETMYVKSTFHTPAKKWIRERVFFERTSQHAELDRKTLAYVKNVTDRKRDLGHNDLRPIGSYAIVPLVLRDKKYIGAFIEHMRGIDLDHESFHCSLIEELLARFGLCEETMDLIAYRAVDGAGQHGEANLQLACAKHGLREKLGGNGLEDFAARVDRISKRKPGQAFSGYRELYVANAGKALFAGEPEKHARWLAFFEKKKLAFDARDREVPEPKKPWTPPKWRDEWADDDDDDDD